ncbi:MAG: hypothetical protein FD125_1699 [bacterium]|nr:MAG: hypothetical protein FD125_1699 [bacterium]
MNLGIPLWLLALASQSATPEPPHAWTLTHPGSEIVAETTLQTGQRLIARCVSLTRTNPDGFERKFQQVYLDIHGLTGMENHLNAIRPGEAPDRLFLGEWLGGADAGQYSALSPARTVRLMRATGRFDIEFRRASVGPDEPAGASIAADLPADRTALDQVLEGCDEPLQSARDFPTPEVRQAAMALVGRVPRWARYPMPEYPERALMNDIPGGLVAMSCIHKADGDFADCIVTFEQPLGQGFGYAGLVAARRGSVVEPLEGAHSVWLYRFILPD